MENLLAGKVAIITGAGSGLGEETARQFAKQGAKVVLADFNYIGACDVASEINDSRGEVVAVAFKVNVADHEAVKNMVDDVIGLFDKIDILINNAGITKDSTLLKMTHEQWQDVVDVNLTGVFNCTRYVAPYMVAQGSGKIVNTSSIVRNGNFGQTNYVATKSGVVGMTKTWARELGRKGINVNAVAFGFMATPMTDKMPPEVLESMAKQVPLKRLGTTKDASNAYLILSCGMSDYINGTVLEVDGGLTV